MERAIPNKLYFRIGEVSDLVGVKPYVLRYWETEFGDIKPTKSKSGQRLYKRRDVEMLMKIKELLYNERFTIDGARKRLKDDDHGGPRTDEEAALGAVNRISATALKGQVAGQLDAFTSVDDSSYSEITDETDCAPSVATRSKYIKVANEDNRKLLTKIKTDLSALLELVRE
ncbi:MAG: MerR family transcriptional regulator [Pseudomonadota bacterium]